MLGRVDERRMAAWDRRTNDDDAAAEDADWYGEICGWRHKPTALISQVTLPVI